MITGHFPLSIGEEVARSERASLLAWKTASGCSRHSPFASSCSIVLPRGVIEVIPWSR